MCCKRCGSFAINHKEHGRDGSDRDLCDVCFWRKRAEQARQWVGLTTEQKIDIWEEYSRLTHSSIPTPEALFKVVEALLKEKNHEVLPIKSSEISSTPAVKPEPAKCRRKTLDEYIQEREQQREKEAPARKQFADANATTRSLLESMPELFVDELNKTVRGVWNELKPVEINGKNKGQSRSIPVFQIQGSSLVLAVDTWKSAKKVHNPVCILENGKISLLWSYDAWREATKRMTKLLEELSKPKN